MTTQSVKIIGLIVLMSLTSYSAFGQEEKQKTLAWGEIGCGLSNRFKIGTGCSFSVAHKKFLALVRYVRAENTKSYPYGLGMQRRAYEAGLCAGIYLLSPKNVWYFAAAGGPGYEVYYAPIAPDGGHSYLVSGNGVTIADPVERFSTLTFSIDSQFGINIGRHLGLGIHSFATWNKQGSFGGFLFSIRAGSLFSKPS